MRSIIVLILVMTTTVLLKRTTAEEGFDITKDTFRLKSFAGTYLKADSDGSQVFVRSLRESATWKLMPMSHKVYRFKNNDGMYLAARSKGKERVWQSDKANAETAWQVKRVGDKYTFRNLRHKTYLHAEAELYVNAVPQLAPGCHWTAEPAELVPSRLYHISGIHGGYLTAHEYRSHVDQRPPQPYSTWKWIHLYGSYYRLKSVHGTYLRGTPHFSGVVAQSNAKDDYTAWDVSFRKPRLVPQRGV